MLAQTVRRVSSVVVIVAVMAACGSGAGPSAPGPGPSGSPDATWTPTAGTATPTAVPSPPSPTTTPAPTATPIDARLVLRVEVEDDLGEPHLPPLSVYADGTVLWDSFDSGAVVARFDPVGLPDLLAAVGRDASIDAGDIDMEPGPHDHGFSFTTITIRVGDALIEKWVANPPLPERRAEADRVFALVERLVDPLAWDLGVTWLVSPAAATRWVPERYRLETLLIDGPDPAIRKVDVADIPWPLPGELMEFGEAYPDDRPFERCGVVPVEVALGIEAAFGGSDLPGAFHTGYLDLTWEARDAHGSLWLVAVVPDAPTGCPGVD